MGYRLKNSDFRLFLGVLEGKVKGSGVYVGEGRGYILECFRQGKVYPGVRGWSAGEVE